MDWYIIVILCALSCWLGMFLMTLFSSSKCGDCKSRNFNDITLKCKQCGTENLHITNRFKYPDNKEDYIVICHTCGTEYEIHNNIKNNVRRDENHEN